jgi:hypothetical protein
MLAVLKTFTKWQADKRRLTMDYSCFLAETEILTNFAMVVQPFTVDAPLAAGGGYVDPTSKMITFYVSEGRIGQVYRVSMIADTNQGQVKRDDIGVRVV